MPPLFVRRRSASSSFVRAFARINHGRPRALFAKRRSRTNIFNVDLNPCHFAVFSHRLFARPSRNPRVFIFYFFYPKAFIVSVNE